MEKMNIYCDESCHLEHDGQKVMVIGGIRCLYNNRRKIRQDILEIKEKHGISPWSEIKWNKVSNCNVDYFKDLIDYFFNSDELEFRCVVVDKTKLKHEEFGQTHDEFYYKMYFHCLSGLVSPHHENYLYLDKKDTKGSSRINNLKFFLCRKTHDFDEKRIRHIQCVTSSELPILQLTDLLIGAIGYHNRIIDNPGKAKKEIVDYIRRKSGYSLEKTTFLSERKFNLFFIDLQ